MRSASLVLFLIVPFAACSTEPESRVEPAQVNWMEWPAEVSVGTPFTTRVAGWSVSCVEVLEFVTTPTVDQSAVTFEPYFLIGNQREVCPLYLARQGRIDALSIVAPYYDAQVAVPGLEAQSTRTYEIRASTYVGASAASALPIRTFGDITVSTSQVENGRINAGGIVWTSRDSTGCVTLYPYGPVAPPYVVENPPDTALSWGGFVRGYIYDAPAPVCGKSTVFHLVTRN